MVVTEFAQTAHIAGQPVAVPRQEITTGENSIDGSNHDVNMTRFISIFVPVPLEFAQFSSNSVKPVTAITTRRQVVLRDIQIGPHPVKQGLAVAEIAGAIGAVGTWGSRIALRSILCEGARRHNQTNRE